jgi:signal transduction histidine kinase
MIVRTLFLKIFLWFWLALILVVATVILVVEPPRVDRGRGGVFEVLTEFQLRGLAALYAHGNSEEFERQRNGLEDAMGFSVFIVRGDGTEVTGRTVPSELLGPARRRVDGPRRGPMARDGEREGGRGGRGNPDRGPSEQRGGTDRPPARIFAAEFTDVDGTKLLAFAQEARRWGGGPQVPSATAILSNTDFLSLNVLLRIGAILVVAGLVCWGMARYLTAPIRRLQAASRDLESGELSVKINPDLAKRHDEIGELARDFDRMARRVSTVISTQRQLLRDVSHELRSPLARLHVAVELAGEGAPAPTVHALERVRREADRLEELIGQLLALARLESGAVEQERTDVDLAETLKTIVDDAQFEASARGRTVQLIRCDACVAHGVPTLIRSAIDNVIRNAVDFTPEGTAVDVALEASTDGDAVITVRDHGPGVPPESLQKIFEPFFRTVTSGSRPRNGTGLGLAITDRAVRLHRGTIVAANAEGGGLIVRITMPLNVATVKS